MANTKKIETLFKQICSLLPHQCVVLLLLGLRYRLGECRISTWVSWLGKETFVWCVGILVYFWWEKSFMFSSLDIVETACNKMCFHFTLRRRTYLTNLIFKESLANACES